MAESITITYIEQSEESVKRAFDTLMIYYDFDKDRVLSALWLNPIAVANQALWSATLNTQVTTYPAWSGDSVNYYINDIISYAGHLYRVVQEHLSQPGWHPGAVSMFEIYRQRGKVYPFIKPTGAHDAYDIGDMVLFEDYVYKSLADGNVYSPTEYPQNWELIS